MLHLPTRHIPSLVWPSPWLTSGLRKYNKPFSLTFKAYRIDERNLIVHAVSCKQSKHRAPPFLPLPQRLRLQTSSSSQILGDLNRQTCTNSEVPKSVWNPSSLDSFSIFQTLGFPACWVVRLDEAISWNPYSRDWLAEESSHIQKCCQTLIHWQCPFRILWCSRAHPTYSSCLTDSLWFTNPFRSPRGSWLQVVPLNHSCQGSVAQLL